MTTITLNRKHPTTCRLVAWFATGVLLFTTACAPAADEASKNKNTGGENAKAGVTTTADAKPADDAQTAEVRKFIEKYFRTWSNVEMDAYGECFWPNAVVQFIDGQGNIDTQSLRDFLAAQRNFQLRQPGKEVPLKIEITFEKRLARAVAYWKLNESSGRISYGYDHYTLLQREGKWRIANLTFYEVEPPK